MPNNTTNEVVICASAEKLKTIKDALVNAAGEIDFGILLPIPLNVWRGNVGKEHEKFPDNALAWRSKNWGTKWGPYGEPVVVLTDDEMTLKFETAWTPPRGWLLAIWNKFQIPFTYYFHDEYDDKTYRGTFSEEDEWKEIEFPEVFDRLMIQKYGEDEWVRISKEVAAESEDV